MTIANYGAIRTLDDLQRLTDRLGERDSVISIDCETGYPGPDRESGATQPHAGAFIVGFSLTDNPSWARYVPLRHDLSPDNLDPDKAWDIVRPLLEQKRFIAHNAKFEIRNFRKDGIELGIVGDTMLQAYALGKWPSVGLKDLTERLLGHQMIRLVDLFPAVTKKRQPSIRFNVLEPSGRVVEYACEDAVCALRLYERFTPEVERERKLVYRLELAVLPILVEMEEYGMAVDWEGLARARQDAEVFIGKLEVEVLQGLSDMAGRPLVGFNLGSPPQLRRLLFDEMGLSSGRLTPKGQQSTDAVAMNRLAKSHPALDRLLRLREVENLRNRMKLWLEEDPVKPRVRGDDGRVHASYAQALVPTGRFAANDPAVQQLPKRWRWALDDGTEFSGNFRDFLVASPGHYYLGFDYSQIELRVIAGLAKERRLLQAFDAGEDVHSVTASLMLGIMLGDIGPDERMVGKTLNFGLIYGMGEASLAERLAVSRDRAHELSEAYKASLPAITAWEAEQWYMVREKGYTESWLGRRATVWELQSSNRKLYGKARRLVVNYPVQGGAADVMKVAMVLSHRCLGDAGLLDRVRLVANLHDALTWEVHSSLDPRHLIRMLRPVVEIHRPPFPRMVTEWEWGRRWGSGQHLSEDADLVEGPDGWMPSGGMVPLVKEYDEFFDDAEGQFLEETPEPMVLVESSGGKTIIVDVPAVMPDAFQRFVQLVQSRPGSNTVVLRTSGGDVRVPDTALGLSDSLLLGTLFPAAQVYLPPEEVDVAALGRGLRW